MAPLEALITTLAKKIDTALDGDSHASAFEEIGRRFDRFESRVEDSAPTESLARIEAMLAEQNAERQFADLAQRIDELRQTIAARLKTPRASAIPNISPRSRIWCAASTEKWTPRSPPMRGTSIFRLSSVSSRSSRSRSTGSTIHSQRRDLANRTLGSTKSSSASTGCTPHSRSGSKRAGASRNERASWRLSSGRSPTA